LQGTGPSAAALRGVLLATSVVLALSRPTARGVAQVRDVLRQAGVRAAWWNA